MATRLEAATRLKADRGNHNEYDWHSQHSKEDPDAAAKKAKKEQYQKDHDIVNGLRKKIQDEQEKLKGKKGPERDAGERLIKGLKERANKIWGKWSLSDIPLYKIEAIMRRLKASVNWS